MQIAGRCGGRPVAMCSSNVLCTASLNVRISCSGADLCRWWMTRLMSRDRRPLSISLSEWARDGARLAPLWTALRDLRGCSDHRLAARNQWVQLIKHRSLLILIKCRIARRDHRRQGAAGRSMAVTQVNTLTQPSAWPPGGRDYWHSRNVPWSTQRRAFQWGRRLKEQAIANWRGGPSTGCSICKSNFRHLHESVDSGRVACKTLFVELFKGYRMVCIWKTFWLKLFSYLNLNEFGKVKVRLRERKVLNLRPTCSSYPILQKIFLKENLMSYRLVFV